MPEPASYSVVKRIKINVKGKKIVEGGTTNDQKIYVVANNIYFFFFFTHRASFIYAVTVIETDG